jgi:integrase
MADARSFRGSDSDTAAQAAAVAAAIARYAPCSLSERSARLAREVVAKASPPTPDRAKALLLAAGKLAAFAEAVGLEPCGESLLQEALIERFVRCGCSHLSPATRRTLRTNLRALARAWARYGEPRPVSLPRERAKAPYSETELAGYLALAGAQSTKARRMRASALICLGAGAGIVAGELRHVRGQDVSERSGGVIVRVSGQRTRVVPVLARFHEPLLRAAAFAGEHFIIGGRDPERHNITDTLARALSADSSLPRLQAGRLRSSWLCACALQIGLGAFMAAAGVVCSQRLGDIAASLPAIEETQMVALLGGADGR